jgi:hypothetical protein
MSQQQYAMVDELEQAYFIILDKAVSATMEHDTFTKDELSLMARAFGISLPREAQ